MNVAYTDIHSLYRRHIQTCLVICHPISLQSFFLCAHFCYYQSPVAECHHWERFLKHWFSGSVFFFIYVGRTNNGDKKGIFLIVTLQILLLWWNSKNCLCRVVNSFCPKKCTFWVHLHWPAHNILYTWSRHTREIWTYIVTCSKLYVVSVIVTHSWFVIGNMIPPDKNTASACENLLAV